MQLGYLWTRFRGNLICCESVREHSFSDWKEYIDSIDWFVEVDCKNFYYLLLDSGWLYEGTISGIKAVLYDYPTDMEDFYLVPKDYSWIVCHCDDGACMTKMQKTYLK